MRHILDFFCRLSEFNKTMRSLKHSPVGRLSLEDAFYLAAVATELGVGLQEAKDGTWRQRFSVVDA